MASRFPAQHYTPPPPFPLAFCPDVVPPVKGPLRSCHPCDRGKEDILRPILKAHGMLERSGCQSHFGSTHPLPLHASICQWERICIFYL